MAIDLEKTLREQGKTKTVRVVMPSFSATFERELASIYLEVTRIWTTSVTKELIAEYKKELELRDSPEMVLNTVDDRMVRALITFARKWRRWSEKGTRMHYRTLISKLKYSTGVDLSSVISVRGPQTTLDDLLRWNTELIRNINEQTRQRISSAIYSGLTNRTPVTQIAKEIRESTGMSADRARRIASDQTVKLNSALDAERLHELGCEGYEWMHSGKAHPRIEHQNRNGDYIKFGSDIDETDAPGQAPFCGCKRRMILNPPED